MNQARHAILLDIIAERFRQKRLLAAGKFDRDMAAPSAVLTPPEKLGVLAEEFGEVARIVADDIAKPVRAGGSGLDTAHLREELIQLATCCVAWVEELDDVPQEVTFEQARDMVVYADDHAQDGLPIAVFAVQPGAS